MKQQTNKQTNDKVYNGKNIIMNDKEYYQANWNEASIKTQKELEAIKDRRKESSEKQSEIKIDNGIPIYQAFVAARLCSSLNEAKRLITQHGLYINKKCVDNPYRTISKDDIAEGFILLQRGKKQFCRVSIN